MKIKNKRRINYFYTLRNWYLRVHTIQHCPLDNVTDEFIGFDKFYSIYIYMKGVEKKRKKENAAKGKRKEKSIRVNDLLRICIFMSHSYINFPHNHPHNLPLLTPSHFTYYNRMYHSISTSGSAVCNYHKSLIVFLIKKEFSSWTKSTCNKTFLLLCSSSSSSIIIFIWFIIR